jgi:hypothetical protein
VDDQLIGRERERALLPELGPAAPGGDHGATTFSY